MVRDRDIDEPRDVHDVPVREVHVGAHVDIEQLHAIEVEAVLHPRHVRDPTVDVANGRLRPHAELVGAPDRDGEDRGHHDAGERVRECHRSAAPRRALLEGIQREDLRETETEDRKEHRDDRVEPAVAVHPVAPDIDGEEDRRRAREPEETAGEPRRPGERDDAEDHGGHDDGRRANRAPVVLEPADRPELEASGQIVRQGSEVGSDRRPRRVRVALPGEDGQQHEGSEQDYATAATLGAREAERDHRKEQRHAVAPEPSGDVGPALAVELERGEPIARAELRVVRVRERPREVPRAPRVERQPRRGEHDRPDGQGRESTARQVRARATDERDARVHDSLRPREREEEEHERGERTRPLGLGLAQHEQEPEREKEHEERVLEAGRVPDHELRRAREKERCQPARAAEPGSVRGRRAPHERVHDRERGKAEQSAD